MTFTRLTIAALFSTQLLSFPILMGEQDYWKAENYFQNSSSQQDAASDLLKYITICGNEKILDVGCGDGKITASLAKKLPNGSIIGLDYSPSMIKFAKTTFTEEDYPNLKFVLGDAQDLHHNEDFDLILSFTTLQWILKHDAFLAGAFEGLTPSGTLAITMPMGLPSSLEQAAKEVSTSRQWALYFEGFSTGWNFVEKDAYSELLSAHGFVPQRLVVVPQKDIFPSRDVFEKFLGQWFPYLRPLPDTLKKIFMNQVLDRFAELEGGFPDGEVHFKIRRLEVVATKD